MYRQRICGNTDYYKLLNYILSKVIKKIFKYVRSFEH